MGGKITERALVQRINRKLGKVHQSLRKTRGYHVNNDLGEYYILDTHRNSIIESRLERAHLEEFARQLNVFAPHEELEDKILKKKAPDAPVPSPKLLTKSELEQMTPKQLRKCMKATVKEINSLRKRLKDMNREDGGKP
jgi:hypothetical protein